MSEAQAGWATVRVELGERAYPIHIGAGVLDRGDLLREHVAGNQVAVVSNDVVAPLYLQRLRRALGDGYQIDVFLMPDGERHKSLETYGRLMDFLLEHRHNRTTTLVALGGGVVGDLAGFAAATYQRGVGFIQVPTTLLAQVDSSVGGKTAVNHPRGKNMIGAFYQPRCVLADIGVFDTLPEREYRAGLAEMVKYGVIRDAGFFDWLEGHADALARRDVTVLGEAVGRSCEVKAEVVAADEREGGLRAILNFGHTFGHAIETLTGYDKLLHGEAVAVGMVMAADLSARQGLLDPAAARRLRDLLTALSLPVTPPALSPASMRTAMGLDKKVVDGRLRLILAQAVGRVVITEDVDDRLLGETLAAGARLCDG
jgi:3-dehydroquinate synthase